MTNQKTIWLAIAVSISGLLVSCNKDKDPDINDPNSSYVPEKIQFIYENGESEWLFPEFNSENKLIRLTTRENSGDEYFDQFERDQNNTLVTTHSSQVNSTVIVQTTQHTASPDGKIIRGSRVPGGSDATWATYEYDTEGYLIKSTEVIPFTGDTSISTYTYFYNADKDLTSYSSHTIYKQETRTESHTLTELSYYSDEDLLSSRDMPFFGVVTDILATDHGNGSKHLVKSIKQSNSLTQVVSYEESYTYEINKDGYPTKVLSVYSDNSGQETGTMIITYK